jgi:hypothetical protein
MATVQNSINNAVGATFTPLVSDGAALGTTALMFSDLFLASGAVANWNNGDVTLTHSSHKLAFAGGSSGYTFDALISPAASDGAALGSGTVMWSDLFLANGAVLNFNNGAATLTHTSSTVLTLGGSSLTTLDLGALNITGTGSLGATGSGKLTKIWAVSGEFSNAPTIGGTGIVYYSGGTDVAVTDGGTGLSTMTTAYGVVCAGTTAGQVLTSNGAAALPSFQSSAGGMTWSVVTSDQAAAVNTGYITNKSGSVCVVTLPATSAVGSLFRVSGINATGWKIAQNTGQTIHFGTSDSTAGTDGYIASTATRDGVELVCVVANTDFNIISGQGNITVA